ncbi:MAG TPA: hypothetical protein VMN78_08725 [Longimicrobiales bacterium]|nr:hypothetical protein [Longimicrobiales bacterium]
MIGRVDEAEVIAEFLRGELGSPRFGARVRARLEQDGRDVDVIEHPDTTNGADNAYRATLLHAYRGVGGSAPLLESLPDGIEWSRVELEPDELRNVRYMDYPYWNELSAGSRSPARAAAGIRAGVTAMDRPNDAFHAVAERICAGEALGTPILVAPDVNAPLVILEGHTRVTAMLLRPECLPERLDAIVGHAPAVRSWMFYGTPEVAA